jgi:hypothetical protein
MAAFKSGRISPNIRWVLRSELGELPLSTTGRKIANLVTRK